MPPHKPNVRWPALVALLALVALGARPVAASPATPMGACEVTSWQKVSGPGDAISSLAGSAALGRVFAGSSGALEVNDGQALWSGGLHESYWAPVPDFRNLAPVTDVLVTPGLATQVWVGTFRDGRVFGSDSGDDYTFGGRGDFRGWTMRLAAREADVYAAVSTPGAPGIYRWDGAEWQPTGDVPAPTTVVYNALEVGAGGQLYVGADSDGVWRSEDDGATWAPVGDASLAAATVLSLAAHPEYPGFVIAGLGPAVGATGIGGYEKGLRVSRDGGESWSAPAFPGASAVPALAVSHTEPDTVVASVWGDGLQISRDGGRRWARLMTPPTQRRFFEALLTVDSGIAGCELLFAGGQGGVWVRNLLTASAAGVHLPLTVRNADLRDLPAP